MWTECYRLLLGSHLHFSISSVNTQKQASHSDIQVLQKKHRECLTWLWTLPPPPPLLWVWDRCVGVGAEPHTHHILLSRLLRLLGSAPGFPPVLQSQKSCSPGRSRANVFFLCWYLTIIQGGKNCVLDCLSVDQEFSNQARHRHTVPVKGLHTPSDQCFFFACIVNE